MSQEATRQVRAQGRRGTDTPTGRAYMGRKSIGGRGEREKRKRKRETQ